MRYLMFLLAAMCLPALAQELDLHRQLIQRQQQSDAFLLQLRQSQERLQVPLGDLARQQSLDMRQNSERQRLEKMSERQLREVKPDAPAELRPYERQRMEEERRPLTVPSQESRQTQPQGLRPLPGAPRGIVELIEAPR
ncbi:MAG: hypothetical protein H7Y16_01820 [Candidatus Parcubacteria bacterium]|nr:hypothetical protein [Burkholderiales bacterium]